MWSEIRNAWIRLRPVVAWTPVGGGAGVVVDSLIAGRLEIGTFTNIGMSAGFVFGLIRGLLQPEIPLD